MISPEPLVSVVMPVYNADRYLPESIESIFSQTLTNFELIIICDSPTSETIQIMSNFQKRDSRMHVIFQDRAGLIASLNKGIQVARGKFIARMDADDVSIPDRLQKQVLFMDQNPECSLVSSHIEFIDETGKFSGFWKSDIRAKTTREIKKRLPFKNCIAHPTVLIRSTVMKKYAYDPNQKKSEDYDLWLRMASDNLNLGKIPEVLVKYRKHQSSVSKKVVPVSLRIKCKLKYIKGQILQRKFSRFNLNVLFYLLFDIVSWPFFFAYSKIFN
jgi:glycosyltransferase involved in cell wall biosynthesis